MYPANDKKNKCKGVWIWYCGVTEYNRLVEVERSEVYKMEKKLKAEFGSKTELNRGTERLVGVRPQKVIAFIEKHQVHDEETEISRVTRPSTQKYRGDKKAYIDSKTVTTRSDSLGSRTHV
mgnify:CR=1 FL=1|tara:strand:+ start:13 stop:375 length:363 start_codon:yes stop_codon:yes gene_type:complete